MKRLWQRVLHLLSGIRRTMKKHLPLLERLLLRKGSSIKILFAKLRSGMGLEHSRHRSPINTYCPDPHPAGQATPWCNPRSIWAQGTVHIPDPS